MEIKAMKVQEAITLIEKHLGAKFIRRYRLWNNDTNRHETCYMFDKVVFDCLGQLRFYAKQAAYTHQAG